MRWIFSSRPRKTSKEEEKKTKTITMVQNNENKSPSEIIVVKNTKTETEIEVTFEGDGNRLRHNGNGHVDKSSKSLQPSNHSNGHCPHTILVVDNNGNKESKKYPGDSLPSPNNTPLNNPNNPNKEKYKGAEDEIPTEDEADSIDLSSSHSLNHSNQSGVLNNGNPGKNSTITNTRVSISWESRVAKYPGSSLSLSSSGSSLVSGDDYEDYKKKKSEEKLVCDKWRVLFDQFDPEGFGEIPWPDFIKALRSKEFQEKVQPGKIQLLNDLALVYSLHSTAITFQHFVNIVSQLSILK